jgi:inner membrane protein involved in colicin E2 resistance
LGENSIRERRAGAQEQKNFAYRTAATSIITSAPPFAILQLEDMALLMGSFVLFAALAAAMSSARRLDWYPLKQGETATQATGE